jgi:hypothetical protein
MEKIDSVIGIKRRLEVGFQCGGGTRLKEGVIFIVITLTLTLSLTQTLPCLMN